MKNLSFFFLILYCCGNALWAQPGKPEPEKLVDSIVYASLAKDQPGAAVGIIQNGEVVFMKGYGVANLEFNQPVTTTTKFNLASCSKQFTAACILLLEKEGKLKLDDDIRMYLTDMPDYGTKITIRELMHHTSGIPTTDVLLLFADKLFETQWDQNDEYKMIREYDRLNFKPNEEHLYSNSGYFLMAKIIEKCTGKTFNAYLQEALCGPLGMKNTIVYSEPGLIMKERSSGYAKNGDQFVERFPLENSVIGSTNEYTTIEDMMLWDKSLLEGGLLGKDVTKLLFNPMDTLNNGDTIKYTFGFNVWKYKGVRIVEHGGYTSGYVSRNHLFPDNNFAVVALGNCENVNVWGISMGIADKMLGLKEDKPKEHVEIPIDKSLYNAYVGSYQLPDGMRFTAELKSDTLWVLIPGAPKFRLVPESNADFFLKEFDAQCTFADVQQNAAQKFIWHQGGSDHPGIRVGEEPELTNEELLTYVGTYRNELLNATYPVIMKDNKIIIELPESFPKYVGVDKELVLSHLDGDRFYATNMGPVVFQRNKAGEITGLTFKDVGRVRNIEFVKI